VTTGAQLEAGSARAAALLAGAGVSPGDRVLWSAGASIEAVMAALGVLRLGAVLVPANPALTDRELAHVVGEVRPAAAVLARPEEAQWAARIPSVIALRTLGLESGGGPGRAPVGEAPAPDLRLDRAQPADPALIVFTSGTTGTPKGAVMSHGNLVAAARSLQLAWRWTAEDRLVLALPLFHVHGLCVGLFGALAAGGSVLLLDRFEPGAVLEAARDPSLTLFFGVPTMYHRLVAAEGAAALGRLRLCVSGSAPLPAPQWTDIRRRAGVAVLERYGMTETMLTVSNPYDGERRPGTVGFPLPGVEVRLAAEGEGARELEVRGPTVFGGYWERPAATAEVLHDGWMATGDLADVDADGYLAIRGRRKELIISGGFNVYPAEVEEVLAGYPGVAEVAVTGTPSDEWGETVTAWVVPAEGAGGLAGLLDYAAERLAPYKRPRAVRVIDALPRNALGKVQRGELR
jgi:malonyl-CoA/methylmalonyl-CoA synthetase